MRAVGVKAVGVKAGRLVGVGCAALLGMGAAWNLGFSAFNTLARQRGEPPEVADGIVALTGGADRIERAMQLLGEGRAPVLLVSGVGKGLDLPELARRTALAPGHAGQVTVGHEATTTVGNAEETAAWVRGRGLRSLIVVTAGYHMPRALLEIGRAMPDVVLYPLPVQPPALRREMEFATVRMLANEFDKYLAVRLGLTRRADAGGGR